MAQQHELAASRESEEFLGSLVSGMPGAFREDETEAEFAEELAAAQADTEEEVEAEEELEGQYEDEFELELESLLGQGEEEDEALLGVTEDEGEDEFLDHEFEGEEFFRGLRRGLRGLGRFVRRGARVLRPLAKVAAPLVGSAIGGPLGGLAGTALSSLLEGEYEAEDEEEGGQRMTAERAQAELLAARAAASESEAEAEALVGAAAATVLARADRRVLRGVHADLIRGAATLAELLHRHRAARPYTGIVPTVVDHTARTLARHARHGHPVTRRTAARVMAGHTARVLGDPRRSERALLRHVRTVRGAGRLGTYPGPLRSPVLPGGATRHRPGGTLQVVTPVRVPARDGRPARVLRVVTNVRVPRGATPASRTAVVRAPGRDGY
jgi:hypothetical protein